MVPFSNKLEESLGPKKIILVFTSPPTRHEQISIHHHDNGRRQTKPASAEATHRQCTPTVLSYEIRHRSTAFPRARNELIDVLCCACVESNEQVLKSPPGEEIVSGQPNDETPKRIVVSLCFVVGDPSPREACELSWRSPLRDFKLARANKST